MNSAPPTFRKLPGRGYTWTGFGCLWLADDHLLEATTLLIYERYRRFFFRDIRAVFIRRTKVQMGWAIGQGICGLLCALIGGAFALFGATNAPDDARIALYILGGIFGVAALFCFLLLAINMLLGPSCACHVLTANGWQELTAPTRLGPAQRALAQLTARLEATAVAPFAEPRA